MKEEVFSLPNLEVNMSNHKKLIKLSCMVSFSALAIIIGLIEIPWIPIPPLGSFLKLDFSDVIILVSLVTIGFLDTFGVIAIRTVVRRLLFGMAPHDWIGEISAVSASLLLMLSFLLLIIILKNRKQDKFNLFNYLITISIVLIIQTVFMPMINFFFVTPMFVSLFMMDNFHVTVFGFMNEQTLFSGWNDYLVFTLIAFVPFNLLKSFLIANIFFFIRPTVTNLYNTIILKQ